MLPKSVVASSETPNDFHNVNELSTWLWDTTRIVSETDVIIRNLVDHKVTDLFLQVNADIEIKNYQDFISKASKNGIRVHALDGAPSWVAGQKGLTQQQQFTDWLVRYQAASKINEQFLGIHIDVEPYGHADYEGKKKLFIKNYQTLIMAFRDQADAMGLEFGIDIPFWYYGVNYNNIYGQGNIAEFLSKNVKNISIMAYRDSANASNGNDGIIAIAAAQMKLFEKYNVKGTIAVETGRLTEDTQFVTFYEESNEYLYQELNTVYEHYKNHPAFNGIAIHYYESWMSRN